jgi:hypothetical protein
MQFLYLLDIGILVNRAMHVDIVVHLCGMKNVQRKVPKQTPGFHYVVVKAILNLCQRIPYLSLSIVYTTPMIKEANFSWIILDLSTACLLLHLWVAKLTLL